jgi:hypothetical protein
LENMNEVFTYKYSADLQEEINKIRQKYLPKEENGLEQLRKLDRSVEQKGLIYALGLGVLGTLLLGGGLCLVLLGALQFFILGVITGVLGIIGIAAAYPINNYIIRRQRKKLAPIILKLADEISSLK